MRINRKRVRKLQTRLRSHSYENSKNKSKAGIVLAAIGVIIFIFLLSGPRGLIRLVELKMQQAGLNHEIEGLKEENTRLQQEIDKLIHDPATIEKEAREKLGLVRKGEVIYKFIPSSSQSQKSK